MITIPILLFLLIALSFWVLTDSKLPLWIRSACVVGLFGFGSIFWQNTSTFLGWAADGTMLYDIPVTLNSIIIDEPQKTSDGAIYVSVRQPPSIYKSRVLRMFGHPIEAGSPRLYKFKYDRKMHEALQKGPQQRLQKGQKGVRGMFKNPNGEKKKGEQKKGAKGEKGSEQGKGGKKGEGSHSPKSEFWHDIVPRFEYDKDRAPDKQAPKSKYLI